MAMESITRRRVLASAASFALMPVARALAARDEASPVRFGVIADVHHGLAKRTEQRLEEFLAEAKSRKLDFIIQMGDFHHPVPEAANFLKLWHGYRGPQHGVLGNHDMDMGSKAQQVENWRVPGRYYSFDTGFLHFVVLDANFFRPNATGSGEQPLVAYEKANWYRGGITASWIDPEQIEWLKSDLKATKKSTVVFVHQPIDDIWEGGSVPNRAEVRKVLDDSGKVVAVLQGHDHQDASEMRNGIFYWRVNSASYAWVGEDYGRMADYDRSLFAFVEIGEKDEGRRAKVERTEGQSDRGTGRLAVASSQLAGPASPHFFIPSSHYLLLKAEGRRGIFEGDSPFMRGVPNFDRFASSITSLVQPLG